MLLFIKHSYCKQRKIIRVFITHRMDCLREGECCHGVGHLCPHFCRVYPPQKSAIQKENNSLLITERG